MAPIPATPKRRTGRGPGRPRNPVPESAPPFKKRKYVPGGPGGGGRYIDIESGKEILVGGTGPGGYNYTGPRGRVGRLNAEKLNAQNTASPTANRPRRERPTVGPRSSSATAAAAAAAMTQNDGYKPREERGWEEFHPDLDIDTPLMAFSADQVDGVSPPETKPATPSHDPGAPGIIIPNGNGESLASDEYAQSDIPALPPEHTNSALMEAITPSPANGSIVTPLKRRPGRPARHRDSMLTGLGSPPAPRIVPLPSHNPKERLNLPKPSYRQIDTFKSYEQDESVRVNYVDRTLANVGYQESDMFVRPEKAPIRCAEGSIEEDLDLTLILKADGDVPTGSGALGRVEYDMDEQDDRWLEAYNEHRKEEQVEPIKPAIFEITMTQIEKEWHALEKRIPKPNPKPPQTHRPRSSSAAAVTGEPAGLGEEQDTKCAICDDGDCENTNAIVFCDGCDLAVHQECYGVPFIPEGQWLCRKCQLIGRGTPTCIFCPNVDGAFKQTSNLKWSHLLCAIWIPEVTLGNTTFMEPVMDVEKVPRQRWKLTCYICHQKMGACIQCGNKNCFTAFHVTCARRAKLFLKMKSAHGSPANLDASVLKAFCDKHVPTEWRRENDVERATQDAKDFYRRAMRGRRWGDSQQSALNNPPIHSTEGGDDGYQHDDHGVSPNKRRRSAPPKNVWRLPSGAPIVPQAVYHNVENSLIRFGIRKRKEYVAEACKYWTLKREARRGASLLKRLQLQMETFTSMEVTRRNFAAMGAVGRERLARRIEFARMLEDDMEQIRVLCEKVKEREAEKLRDVELLKAIVDTVYFPVMPLLWPILEKAQNLDAKNFFADGFKLIQAKLEERSYTSVSPFTADLISAISSVIWLPVHHDINGITISHSALTPEQKEKKKVAKRIAKAIQGTLEDATRKEGELGGRPMDKELRILDGLLDNIIRPPILSPTSAGAKLPPTQALAAMEVGHVDAMAVNEEMVSDPVDLVPVQGAEPDDVKDDEDARTGAANEIGEHSRGHGLSKTHAAAAGVKAEIGVDTLSLSTSSRQMEGLRAGGIGCAVSNISALPSDGTSLANADLLTPPRSEPNSLTGFANGGIPWYLEPFDPVGTTVHEERWTGREVLRGMSEELSELDDDEVNGLVEEEMPDTLAIDVPMIDPDAVPEVQKAPRRMRRRARAYR